MKNSKCINLFDDLLISAVKEKSNLLKSCRTNSAKVSWLTTVDRDLKSQLQFLLKDRKPVLTVPSHSNLHSVYVYFPMRSRESRHIWAQLQPAEPRGQSAEATPPLLHKAVFVVFSECVNIGHLSCSDCTKFYTALPLVLINKPKKCEVDWINGSRDTWIANRHKGSQCLINALSYSGDF